MNIQLSEAQRSLLTAAAAPDDRCIYPAPAHIWGGAVGNVCRSLVRRGLIEEAPAGDDHTVWRCDDGGAPLTLRVTDAGIAAVQPEGTAGESSFPVTSPEQTDTAQEGDGGPKSRSGKQEALVALLRRTDGATIAELQDVTGWQPHSVRGALSGIVRKKLGHEVTSAKEEGRSRVYRIVS